MKQINVNQCWCGSQTLDDFSGQYYKCRLCQTLISNRLTENKIFPGGNSVVSFYGKDYWLRHVKEELGLPDIFERSRSDIAERCIYWLRDILKYKLPPAKTLELGCAHGGLVYLMKLAGYDAAGTEMSDWICEYATKTFNIPMLYGRIEDLEIPSKSLDIVILMDVLEHMTDPFGGLSLIADILKDNGMVVIQTPCWRDRDKTYQEMKEEGNIFLQMLLEQEHLYLFNEDSLKRILQETGFPHIAVEKQIFPYDIFIFACKQPLTKIEESNIVEEMQKTPEKRIVLALLDLYGKLDTLTNLLEICESDRVARLDVINRINEQLQICETDRAARLDAIHQLTATIHQLKSQLETCEKDRAARLDVINALDEQVKEFQRKYGRPG